MGNFLDRIFRHGSVVDMIKLDFINYPVFNFADCCVVVGAVLLCVYIIFYYDADKARKKEKTAESSEEKRQWIKSLLYAKNGGERLINS
ncbi:MAG: signal peptidase II [Clostridiales bacterium]|nr:MAG: signal peptidase II [Clostridiales bacterium]